MTFLALSSSKMIKKKLSEKRSAPINLFIIFLEITWRLTFKSAHEEVSLES
jgi:hypothetical protein